MSIGPLQYDVAILGGGIVGLATAMALAERGTCSLIVLEAEDRLAVHQTGRNSGVIHSGLYYKPGSKKARMCVAGREALYRFCRDRGVPHERCGKVVVATNEAEVAALGRLAERGLSNGLSGLRRLSQNELREHEPHVGGLAGLYVPDTGIVSFKKVAESYAEVVRAAGHPVQTGMRIVGVREEATGLCLETSRETVRCSVLVSCCGLQADRVARMCGIDPGVRILPFRGEYHELVPERRHLVRHLIYPVPDPRFPFLGVHFTRTIQGVVEAGPNAVLALKREGYSRWSFSPRDALEIVGYRGSRALARRHIATGVRELHRSWSRRALVRALKRLIPEIRRKDLRPAASGVRAQAVDATGALLDDFHVVESKRMVHVLNAPSPAATASIAIGEVVADLTCKHLA